MNNIVVQQHEWQWWIEDSLHIFFCM